MHLHALLEPPARPAQLFGGHLVERGVISQAQLDRALERQRLMQPSFGRVAHQLDLLSLDDVMHVLSAQRGNPLRFGDLAVELGLLTVEQTELIAQAQRETKIPLGQVLVSMGILEPEEVDEELRRFEQARMASEPEGAVRRTG